MSLEWADLMLAEIEAWERDYEYENPEDELFDPEDCVCCMTDHGPDQGLHEANIQQWYIDEYIAGVEAMYSAMLEARDGPSDSECMHGCDIDDCNACW